MFELELSRCPICQTERGLNRRMRDVKGQHFIWYECPECGSALMWLGGDRWIYQHIGRTDRQYLLKRPLTTVELQALSAASALPTAAPSYARQEAPAEETVEEEAEETGAAPEAAKPAAPGGLFGNLFAEKLKSALIKKRAEDAQKKAEDETPES